MKMKPLFICYPECSLLDRELELPHLSAEMRIYLSVITLRAQTDQVQGLMFLCVVFRDIGNKVVQIIKILRLYHLCASSVRQAPFAVNHISKFYGRSLTYLLVFNCVGGLFKAYMMSVGQQALHGVTGHFGLQPLHHFQGRL